MLMKMMKMTVNVMLVMMRTTKTMIAMLIPVAGAITVSTTGRRTATNLDSRTEAPMTTKNDGPCNCDGYHEKTRKNNNDSIQASLNARERERGGRDQIPEAPQEPLDNRSCHFFLFLPPGPSCSDRALVQDQLLNHICKISGSAATIPGRIRNVIVHTCHTCIDPLCTAT